MHYIIDWKQHVLKLAEQKAYIESNHFKLNPLEMFDNERLKEPFVSDIDHTNTGVFAFATQPNQITFLNYPSYTILRRLTLQIDQMPPSWSCQIMGIQTVKIQDQKVRFCCIIVGQSTSWDQEEEDIIDSEDDDLMQIWKTVLIYRLFDDGKTTLVANITMNRPRFLGRDVFFFNQIDDMQSWLDTLSTEIEKQNPFTVFMLAYGPIFPRYAGCAHVFQFDARADLIDQDPSKTIMRWDSSTRQLVKPPDPTQTMLTYKPAQLISTVRLGIEVNCMIHLRQPPQLNHLICTGNFDTNDLTICDWRFGLRVGVLSGTTPTDDISNDTRAATFATTTTTTADAAADVAPTFINVPNTTTTTITTTENNPTREQPWGFEATFAVPPPPSVTSAEEMMMYGLRLVVVGDCDDMFNIKIWDLSHLLQVQWHPFAPHHYLAPSVLSEQDELDMTFIYPWWHRGSSQLKSIAVRQRPQDKSALPYSTTSDALLQTHVLEAQVKYSAYNVLNSLMYLVNEDGSLKVMDIETGRILAAIDTGSNGVDVNVLGTREITVIRKEGILRALIPK